MQNFLETIGVIKNKNSADFKMFPAILLMVLMLTFVGTTIYILISSLNY
jgi:hypothetical protein